MQELSILSQVLIAAGIINVWVFRYAKPSPWRPEGATNMREEFQRYGFPDWIRSATGVTKLILAALLVAGIWSSTLAAGAGAAMAALMAIAIIAHLRIGDPLKKALPAFSLFALSAFVAYANAGA